MESEAQAEGGPPPSSTGDVDPTDVRSLLAMVHELQAEVRQLKAFQRHQESSWGQKVFLIQPDSGGTLYSESNLSYSGTNPTTAPLSDQTGTIARSFLQADLIVPGSGAAAVMEFDNGTQRAYVKLPGGGGVDLLQGGTNVISATPFINIPSNRATSSIFEFTTVTISGTPGANFQFKTGASTRQVLQFNGTNVVWDYVRFHT